MRSPVGAWQATYQGKSVRKLIAIIKGKLLMWIFKRRGIEKFDYEKHIATHPDYDKTPTN